MKTDDSQRHIHLCTRDKKHQRLRLPAPAEREQQENVKRTVSFAPTYFPPLSVFLNSRCCSACVALTHPTPNQCTCLFQPHTLRHQDTHSRIRHQEFRKTASVTVLAAMDHACYAVALVERGGVGVHDRAGKVAANHFRGRE